MIIEAIDEEKIAESPPEPENGEEAPESSAQGLTTAGANVDENAGKIGSEENEIGNEGNKTQTEGNIGGEKKSVGGEGTAEEAGEDDPDGKDKKEEEGGEGEEEEEEAYDEREGMVIDGFKCPAHLLTKITPMEFEEMVHLFQTCDANGSGDIDKHEARKILLEMDSEATLEKVKEFIALVDKDGSGEIEFDEFCEFIHLV